MSNKTKDPAFLFYSSDFLTGTMLMSFEQKGKYITLLCLQHQKGRLSEQDIRKVCGELDPDIMDKFVLDADGYYNERLELEMCKRREHAVKQRENARKRWAKPDQSQGNADAMPPHMPAHQSGIPNGMPLENENENEISSLQAVGNSPTVEKGAKAFKPEPEVELPFQGEAFRTAWGEWLAYRKERKLAKYTQVGLKRVFNELAKYSEAVVVEAINRSIVNNWQGLFPDKVQPQPALYLHQPAYQQPRSYQPTIDPNNRW